nr:MAG TPA: Terminase [Caudoviricetes sp.]
MKNMKTRKIDFFEFVYVWFRVQGLSIPRHQRKMTSWLSALWHDKEKRQGLLMAFRNSGKSTIVGLFCAWALYQDPAVRILVMAADHSLAKKMVRNVKRIIERHPLASGLKPDKLDQWASDQFTVKRVSELRDPSMLAKGLGANITGLRADIIICDDVEVPKNSDTALKRQDMREKLNELDYILTPGGLQLYIGTPHNYYTIYQTSYEDDKKDSDPFLLNFRNLVIPILDDNGKSAWPERFSEDKIASIRARSGENKFLSQMMLQPVNTVDSVLNPDNLVAYEHELEISWANERELLKLGGKKLISASAWWDPSFAVGEGKGDNSVLACVYTDEDGRYWLHDLEYIRISAADVDNAATLQCLRAADFIERNHLPSIHLEANGIGKFLPGILKQTLSRRQLRCAVLETYSTTNKQQRILEAFEVLLAEHALNVHAKIWKTPFIGEMREWSAAGSVHDDALDAVAGCLLSEPVRLVRTAIDGSRAKSFNWQGASSAFNADTNFDI